MVDRHTRKAVLCILLVMLSVVAGGATALSGTAAAQGGGINVLELSTNDPVREGETLVVTAQLECDAAEPCSQEVALRVGGQVRDTVTVYLDETEVVTRDFVWETEVGDAGDYRATVASNDAEDSTGVVVEEDTRDFIVNVEETNSPVIEGNTLAVSATIANTADESDTQPIDLIVGDSTVATTSVSLGPGESETLRIEWETEVGDAGGYTAIVSSEDNTDTAEVIVLEQGEFAVDVDATNSPVVQGEPIDVTATVENTGDETGTQRVELSLDGQVFDSTTVTLEPGDSETVTFTWETANRPTGTYTAGVTTEDGASDATEVTVLDPATFVVNVTRTNSPVVEGDSLDVTATVENGGEARATQTIDLLVGGTAVDSTTVTLEPGESGTVTLSWATIEGDAGEYTAAVAGEDSEDTDRIAVQGPATFAVDIESTNSPITEGGRLDVTAVIENTGGVTATQTIDLTVDGEQPDATSLTLPGGESETVTLHWTTGGGDAGEYTAAVVGEDDEDTTEVRVETPSGANGPDDGPRFEVEIRTTNAPVVAGEPVEVTALVTNVGSETDTQPITLTADGSDRDQQELTLDGGGSESVTLFWRTLHGEAGEYTAAVAGEDDEDTTTVEVTEAGEVPTFSVTIDDVSPPDDSSGRIVVTAIIENVDNRADTQLITLTTDGTQRDQQELTLAGGGSDTVALSWEAEGVDADTIEVEVSSDSDSDTSAAALDGDDGSMSATTWLLLLVLLLVLAGVYYYVRRRRIDERERDIEEA